MTAREPTAQALAKQIQDWRKLGYHRPLSMTNCFGQGRELTDDESDIIVAALLAAAQSCPAPDKYLCSSTEQHYQQIKFDRGVQQPKPVEDEQSPLVHGDEVLIPATYIANTRERSPPLSDRAWVRLEGNDHLSDCPIAAIEKRGVSEGDAWEYWNGRAMTAEAELHEMKHTARSAQDEWRPIETALREAAKHWTACLDDVHYRPRRSHIEAARNSFAKAADMIAAVLPPPPAAPAEKEEGR